MALEDAEISEPIVVYAEREGEKGDKSWTDTIFPITTDGGSTSAKNVIHIAAQMCGSQVFTKIDDGKVLVPGFMNMLPTIDNESKADYEKRSRELSERLRRYRLCKDPSKGEMIVKTKFRMAGIHFFIQSVPPDTHFRYPEGHPKAGTKAVSARLMYNTYDAPSTDMWMEAFETAVMILCQQKSIVAEEHKYMGEEKGEGDTEKEDPFQQDLGLLGVSLYDRTRITVRGRPTVSFRITFWLSDETYLNTLRYAFEDEFTDFNQDNVKKNNVFVECK